LAIKIRRKTGGSAYISSNSDISVSDIKKAEKLDIFLTKEIKKMEQEISQEKLLELKGHPGAVKFWYQLGKRLSALLKKTELVSARDKKYLWRALYDKAPRLFSEENRIEPSERIERFISLALFISELPWEDVKNISWTQWVDMIADQRAIREDKRIANWLVSQIKKHSPSNKQNWTRKLVKAIYNRLGKKDTSVLSDKELNIELENIISLTKN